MQNRRLNQNRRTNHGRRLKLLTSCVLRHECTDLGSNRFEQIKTGHAEMLIE